MKTVIRSEKWMIVIVLTLFAISLVIGYFSMKARYQLVDVRIQASDATQQMEMMEARLAKPITPPDLTKMNQAIPPDWQLPRFFADVTLLANEYEIQIHFLTPGDPIQPEPSEEEQNADQAQNSPDASNGEESMTASEREADQTEGNEASQEESISPKPPKSLPGVYTLPLILEVKGNITEVLAFIDELQRLPRLVWVTGFELLVEDPDENRLYQKPINLRINLNLYSRAPWNAVEYAEEWPFDIQPAKNEEAFDTL